MQEFIFDSNGWLFFYPMPTGSVAVLMNASYAMPPHVHIWKSGHEARFSVWDNQVKLYTNKNMTESELKTAAALCGKHYDRIVAALKEMPWVE